MRIEKKALKVRKDGQPDRRTGKNAGAKKKDASNKVVHVLVYPKGGIVDTVGGIIEARKIALNAINDAANQITLSVNK